MKCMKLIILAMKIVQNILKIMKEIKNVHAIQIWDIGTNLKDNTLVMIFHF